MRIKCFQGDETQTTLYLPSYTPAAIAKGIAPSLPTSNSRTRLLSPFQEAKRTNGKNAPLCIDAL